MIPLNNYAPTFGLLTLSLISLWIPAGKIFHLRYVLFAAALIAGSLSGFIHAAGICAVLLMGAVCYIAEGRQFYPVSGISAGLAVILLTIGMFVHIIPGFSNPKIIAGLQISPDAIPYSKYLNFDKAAAGFFLLASGHRLISSVGEWNKMLKQTVPIAAFTLVLVLIMSLAAGYIRFDMKCPSIFILWAWTNLFFTCMAEEAFFRGFIQKHLMNFLKKYRYGDISAIVSAALLFGIAHYAGGTAYIVLASIAGAGYGAAYYITGKIEAAVISHFVLNTLHFLFFTYPALSSSV